MAEAPSPRITSRKLAVRAGVAAGLLALSGGWVAPSPAAAEDLSTLRESAAAAADQAAGAEARAAAAAAQAAAAQGQASSSAREVGAAQVQVQGSQQRVQTADARLADAERALAAAQQRLFETKQELQAARDYDAKLGADLADARERLTLARQAVVDGQAEVDAQRRLMGAAAREAWQQQTPLEGLSVLVGAQSPRELSQRLQWQDTVFDTQAADKVRLDALLQQLRSARDEQTRIEAAIAADKAAAAAQVGVVAGLTARAQREEASVAVLVAQHAEALQAARAALAGDENALSEARADQAAAERVLDAAQGELAASRAELDRALAESKAREQRVKAEVARQQELERAAAASRAAADRASEQQAEGEEASASLAPHETVSASGFVRPIDRNPGSPFGMRFHPILHVWLMHEGTDFGASCGTPIYAARAGTVLQTGPDGGYGNFTLVGHGTIDGVYVTTGYAHQTRIVVDEGERVARGQVIGYVGNTGLSTTCHLHFEVRHDGTPVNPLRYVP